MDNVFDLTIVGGGPTGLFASFYAGLRGMRTKLIEALPEPGGQVSVLYPEKNIYDVPGYRQIVAKDLVRRLAEQAERFRPLLLFNERAINLRNDDRGLLLLETDKGKHLTRSILIAAGIGAFFPNRLGIPDEQKYDGRGLSYYVKEKASFRGRKVLIVGGGDSAVDWALTLRDWAQEVTLIHRRDVFRAHESRVAELLSSDVGVKLFHELKQLRGRERVEEAVLHSNKTGDVSTIKVDDVLVNIGFRADIGPINSWGLTLDGRRIKVNQAMETNIPGVYAAGDVSSQQGLERLNLISTGFGQAVIAVNYAKKFTDPSSSVHPGHSSDKRL